MLSAPSQPMATLPKRKELALPRKAELLAPAPPPPPPPPPPLPQLSNTLAASRTDRGVLRASEARARSRGLPPKPPPVSSASAAAAAAAAACPPSVTAR